MDDERTPGGQGPNATDARFDRMEALLRQGLGDMQGLMAGLPGLGGGIPAGPGAAGAALASRVAQLEEHFARICTVVGRLDQEVLALKEHLAGHGK
ncbi:MAG: hypothetical protein AAGU21_11605 [Solidesulfovibrio sp.]|uniref:hypothetical protein n=1 Tax=Solidesulfovibrio sp. TaxID=2910990 RepID=UPI002B204B7F|nr:hypothetical protein [Solidesulfovibrio sp.]MEA4857121.1 hypothetical protein [Solidesulfovibrio sp.]